MEARAFSKVSCSSLRSAWGRNRGRSASQWVFACPWEGRGSVQDPVPAQEHGDERSVSTSDNSSRFRAKPRQDLGNSTRTARPPAWGRGRGRSASQWVFACPWEGRGSVQDPVPAQEHGDERSISAYALMRPGHPPSPNTHPAPPGLRHGEHAHANGYTLRPIACLGFARNRDKIADAQRLASATRNHMVPSTTTLERAAARLINQRGVTA